MKTEHAQFAGSVPENYDKYMGPMFFEPYALDLVQRIDFNNAKKILEIACGTGRVTRHLLSHLSDGATLTATDLNGGMIAIAKQVAQAPNLDYKEADAQALPFADNHFDLIVCQFGYMFVPDKPKAFAEAYRVLKPGGTLLFSTWDSLQQNQLTLTIKNVVASYLDEGAADFYNVPFSMYDQQQIKALLQTAGFQNIHTEVVSKMGTHVSAEDAAKGLILGTPAFKAIEAKDRTAHARLIEIATAAVGEAFGKDIVKTALNAIVCEATK